MVGPVPHPPPLLVSSRSQLGAAAKTHDQHGDVVAVLDRALRTASGSDGAAIARLPIHRAWVKSRHETGGQVAVFQSARAQLEHEGLHFGTVPVPPPRISVTQLLRALPRGSIVAAAAGPALGRTVPPRDSLFAEIGGVADLFGGAPYYGVVGVVRRGGTALEGRAAEAVRLEVEIGDPIGSFPVRAMAALRVTSDREDAHVELNGRRVARARAGLALVVVSPDGRLLTTVGDELARGLEVQVALDEPSLYPACQVGAVCRGAAGAWVDVGIPAASGGVSGRLWSRDGVLVVYTTSRSEPPVRLWWKWQGEKDSPPFCKCLFASS